MNQGSLSERAASLWHSPESGLAQSAGPKLKATHALETKQGATRGSEGQARLSWPRPAFLPNTGETALLSEAPCAWALPTATFL